MFMWADSIAGGVVANDVARWDGTNWWPPGGLAPNAAVINCMAIDSNGKRTSEEPSPTREAESLQNVAAWDGNQWSGLGGGITGNKAAVNTLFCGGGRILVGVLCLGWGNPATNIAVWNGMAWSGLGTGLPGSATAITQDLEGNVYAAGSQTPTMANNYYTPFISKWDGTTWTNLPAGNNPSGSGVKVMFVYSDVLYAGGIHLAPPAPPAHLERFNGTNWGFVPAPFYPVSYGPVQSGGKLYFMGPLDNVMSPNPANYPYGIYNVAGWDGTTN